MTQNTTTPDLIERMERIVGSKYADRNHPIHDCDLGQITFGDVRDLCDAARALPAAQDGAEVELVTDADELRAELRRALAQIDSLDAECDRRHQMAQDALAERDAANARVERLAKELAWYGEQARLCRLIHREGDAGRHELSADGGERARAALAQEVTE